MRELLEQRTGLRVLLENDTRARCYAEYTFGRARRSEHNVIYLHMGRGVAIGIVVDGKLFTTAKAASRANSATFRSSTTKSSARAGKKGCLETEVSGIAIEDKMCRMIDRGVNTILRERYDREKSIHIDDIIAAAKNDDNLSIELIEEAGEGGQGRGVPHQHLQPPKRSSWAATSRPRATTSCCPSSRRPTNTRSTSYTSDTSSGSRR